LVLDHRAAATRFCRACTDLPMVPRSKVGLLHRIRGRRQGRGQEWTAVLMSQMATPTETWGWDDHRPDTLGHECMLGEAGGGER
jgi:hypothetical protein